MCILLKKLSLFKQCFRRSERFAHAEMLCNYNRILLVCCYNHVSTDLHNFRIRYEYDACAIFRNIEHHKKINQAMYHCINMIPQIQLKFLKTICWKYLSTLGRTSYFHELGYILRSPSICFCLYCIIITWSCLCAAGLVKPSHRLPPVQWYCHYTTSTHRLHLCSLAQRHSRLLSVLHLHTDITSVILHSGPVSLN